METNNDATAFYNLGVGYYNGEYGLTQNFTKALELWQRAAELGSAISNYSLANSYFRGDGVARDEKKAVFYYEQAAIQGHTHARHNLGVVEHRKGNMDRAMKHYMIAVKSGYTYSLKQIKALYEI